MKIPQTTIAPTFLTHIISGIDGVKSDAQPPEGDYMKFILICLNEDLLDLGETKKIASNSVNHVQISFTESQRTRLHTRKIDRGKVNEIFSEP